MALIGYTAATMNIFLDIPNLLRGVSQSMLGAVSHKFRITPKMLFEIKQVDPTNPTSILDEYFGDWWNFDETYPVEVDRQAAFDWHMKVN